MPEILKQFKPAPQEQPDDSKKNEPQATRRDFLKKAGKFLGGAMVAGSMFEKISKGVSEAGITKKLGAENHDQIPIEAELTDMEAIKTELAGLKEQFPNTWRAEAEQRAKAGIELLIEALNEERGAERTKTAIEAGVGLGAGAGVVRELARSDGNMLGGTKKEIEGKIVDVVNRIGIATALGGALGMGGGKLAERINSKNPDKRDFAFKEIAEKLSSATLRRIGADGKVPDEEFKELGEFIEKELVAKERFMIDKAKLRSHIAKWGAGSFFTARELWDKSPAFRELISASEERNGKF